MSNTLIGANSGFSLGYDSNIDKGYGRNSDPRGVGRSWNMGDALSKPKGEWDDIDLDGEDIDDIDLDFDISIRGKMHTSQKKLPADALSKKKNDISSLGGLGNTVANGLAASHKRSGNLIREFIFEVLNESPHGGGQTSASGVGRMYKPSNRNVSPHGGLGHKTPGIDTKGYAQSRKATTDGGETVGKQSDRLPLEFGDGSTGDEFYDVLNDLEKHDLEALNKHVKKNKYF